MFLPQIQAKKNRLVINLLHFASLFTHLGFIKIKPKPRANLSKRISDYFSPPWPTGPPRYFASPQGSLQSAKLGGGGGKFLFLILEIRKK